VKFPKREKVYMFERLGETKVRKYFCLFSVINNQYVLFEMVYKKYTIEMVDKDSLILGKYSVGEWVGKYITKEEYEHEKK